MPGEPLSIQVGGLLSNNSLGDDGLAYFRLDLAMSGPQAVSLGDALVLGPPSDGSMATFTRPQGYDSGYYGGTAVGNALVQAGGAQNTIGNNPAVEPFLSAPSADLILFSVAHNEQVLLEGTITFPSGVTPGSYTLSLQNVVAHALT